ncbi:MAG: hypothetical protein ACTSWD_04890 [Candidatus Heimdallarchaeota archaeon]
MAKIIIRAQTEEMSKLKAVGDTFNGDVVIIPKSMGILIKDKSGYWREVGK